MSLISNYGRISLKIIQQFHQLPRGIHCSVVNEAARKGTREKARAKKVKVEVQKMGFIPHNQRNKDKLKFHTLNKHVDDSWKQVPKDNVYAGRYYKWAMYSVKDAIECHRETHHPSVYNVPNAPINVRIELNMQAEKATRFVDNVQRTAWIQHKFDHGEDRKIIVFAKEQEILQKAQAAGATLVGGVELIKDIQNGDLLLSEYQYVIAHPNILPDLVVIRGLMKKKFPNPKAGTLGTNLPEIVERYRNGIQYAINKDEHQKNFGLVEASIGTLDMPSDHLETNLKALLEDVNSIRPKREGKFVTRVLLKSPPSSEQLQIDPFVYIPCEYEKTSKQSNDDAAEEDVMIAQQAVGHN